MSIHVFYQPIDVDLIQQTVFPFVRDKADLTLLLERCDDPSAALAVLQPLQNAYAANLAGSDYIDPEWGRCEAIEFLADRLAPSVLEFSRHVWPYWLVNAFTSIDLLPDDFHVLDHYQMPISLFEPLLADIPDIATDLETIADCESMGGVIAEDHVSVVLAAITDELAGQIRDPNDPYFYDAMRELKSALTHASDNALSFTEAIE